MSAKTALVLGGSGETGREVLRCLAASAAYGRVLSLGRRRLDLPADQGYEKVEQAVVDFEALDQSEEQFRGVDAAFCCLGTTRAVAGKEGFVKVDHDYVLGAAGLLKAAGCPAFHLLSGRGADPGSWLLYPSTKGKVEREVAELGFPLAVAYRPGLLLCDRQEKRSGEGLLRWVAGWQDRAHGWSVTTAAVARAMVATSLDSGRSGFVVLDHAAIVAAGKEAGGEGSA